MVDERDFLAMGGSAERVTAALRERYIKNMSLTDALRVAVHGLAHENGEQRELKASSLEVAVLERSRPHRKFRRIQGERLARMLQEAREAEEAAEAQSSEDGGATD